MGYAMTRTELRARFAAATSLTKADAAAATGTVFMAIADALAWGETVSVAGFGKFATRDRAARQGRNPRTGAAVHIAASRVPAFKPAKDLRDASTHRSDRVRRSPRPQRPPCQRHPHLPRARPRPTDHGPRVPLLQPRRFGGFPSPAPGLSPCRFPRRTGGCTAFTKMVRRARPGARGPRLGTFVAGTKSGEFGALVKRAHTCAVPREHWIPSRARSLCRPMRIFSCDSAARRCASQIPEAFPCRLRPPSHNSRNSASAAQHEMPRAMQRSAPRCRVPDHRHVRRREEIWDFLRFVARTNTCKDDPSGLPLTPSVYDPQMQLPLLGPKV